MGRERRDRETPADDGDDGDNVGFDEVTTYWEQRLKIWRTTDAEVAELSHDKVSNYSCFVRNRKQESQLKQGLADRTAP